ncbi:hypothetical protein Cni_G02605 [Canna indica]|uniref:Reverse transcriptase domain-containing protein n=1 Tax=Canna indica TaxID=4628 RepID=A0AAQ3JPI2_9LILI|nr:hypothetical protein Cni_G02605 [Canna indica]
MFSVPSIGRKGGLLLAWKSSVNASMVIADLFFIQVHTATVDSSQQFFFFGLHLHFDPSVRSQQVTNLNHKISSKIPAHRLQPLMEKIISPNQCAFMQGRLISENILLAHEVMHHLKSKPRNSSNEMALKIDMSSAYDKVEWSFIVAIMQALGFSNDFISIIMQYITTISYSISLSGSKFGYFKPDRDDVVIFSKADLRHAQCIKDSLKEFEDISGQQINPQKSTIFFSSNSPQHLRHSLPPKIKVFSCRLLHNCLPLKDALCRKHIPMQDNLCSLCKAAPKGASHLFLYCQIANEVWQRSGLLLAPRPPGSIFHAWRLNSRNML